MNVNALDAPPKSKCMHRQDAPEALRKPQLAQQVAEVLGVSKERAADVVAIVLEEISLGLAQHDDVFIAGFGRFSKRHRKARSGQDLRSGKPLEIPAHHIVSFRPASKLKQALNANT